MSNPVKSTALRARARAARSQSCVVVDPTERRAVLRECEVPSAEKPREVRLRTLDVGICRTDREILAFKHGARPRNRSDWILGPRRCSR